MKDLHHTAKVYPTLLEPQFLLYLAPLFERILISTTLLAGQLHPEAVQHISALNFACLGRAVGLE